MNNSWIFPSFLLMFISFFMDISVSTFGCNPLFCFAGFSHEPSKICCQQALIYSTIIVTTVKKPQICHFLCLPTRHRKWSKLRDQSPAAISYHTSWWEQDLTKLQKNVDSNEEQKRECGEFMSEQQCWLKELGEGYVVHLRSYIQVVWKVFHNKIRLSGFFGSGLV